MLKIIGYIYSKNYNNKKKNLGGGVTAPPGPKIAPSLSSRFLILIALVDLHSCLNVRATASIFQAHLVRYFATMMNSEDLSLLTLFCSVRFELSLSLRERLFQDLVISSIVTVFPKKHPTIKTNKL